MSPTVAPSVSFLTSSLAITMLFARIATFIVVTSFLILNMWFLIHVNRLNRDSCDCVSQKLRIALQFTLAWSILTILAGVLPTKIHPLMLISSFLINLFIYIIVSTAFIYRIEKTQCACAKSKASKTMSILNVVLSVSLVVTGIMVAFGASSGNGT